MKDYLHVQATVRTLQDDIFYSLQAQTIFLGGFWYNNSSWKLLWYFFIHSPLAHSINCTIWNREQVFKETYLYRDYVNRKWSLLFCQMYNMLNKCKDHRSGKKKSPAEEKVLQNWIEPQAAPHWAQRRRPVKTDWGRYGEIKRGVNKVK